jgi:hypothetical protein
VVKRETIQDPKFYDRFFTLVRKFADEDKDTAPTPHSADAH